MRRMRVLLPRIVVIVIAVGIVANLAWIGVYLGRAVLQRDAVAQGTAAPSGAGKTGAAGLAASGDKPASRPFDAGDGYGAATGRDADLGLGPAQTGRDGTGTKPAGPGGGYQPQLPTEVRYAVEDHAIRTTRDEQPQVQVVAAEPLKFGHLVFYLAQAKGQRWLGQAFIRKESGAWSARAGEAWPLQSGNTGLVGHASQAWSLDWGSHVVAYGQIQDARIARVELLLPGDKTAAARRAGDTFYWIKDGSETLPSAALGYDSAGNRIARISLR